MGSTGLVSHILPNTGRAVNRVLTGRTTGNRSVFGTSGTLCSMGNILVPLLEILVLITTNNTLLGIVPFFFCSFARHGRGTIVHILGIHTLFRSCTGGTLSSERLIRTVSLMGSTHRVTRGRPGTISGGSCGSLDNGTGGRTGGTCGRTLTCGRRVRVSRFIYTRLSGFGSSGIGHRITLCRTICSTNLSNVMGVSIGTIGHRLTTTGTLPGGARRRGRVHGVRVRLTGGGLSSRGGCIGRFKRIGRFTRPSVTILSSCFTVRSGYSSEVTRLAGRVGRTGGTNSTNRISGLGTRLGGITTSHGTTHGDSGRRVSGRTVFGHTTSTCVASHGLLIRRRGFSRLSRVTTRCRSTGVHTRRSRHVGRRRRRTGHGRLRTRLTTHGTTGGTGGGSGGWCSSVLPETSTLNFLFV